MFISKKKWIETNATIDAINKRLHQLDRAFELDKFNREHPHGKLFLDYKRIESCTIDGYSIHLEQTLYYEFCDKERVSPCVKKVEVGRYVPVAYRLIDEGKNTLFLSIKIENKVDGCEELIFLIDKSDRVCRKIDLSVDFSKAEWINIT